MITQAIKNWIHKLFAWWPWKQSSQIEYTQVASPLNKGTTQESTTRSAIDGVAPQAGIAPRLSTIEEWPERIVQPSSDPSETPLLPPPALANGPEREAQGEIFSSSPILTTQQRLEFLQYLVKRGIVNEGFTEDNHSNQ